MPLVNWNEISPSIEAVYSSLENPSLCDELDEDVAALKLPSGYGIDVAWNDVEKTFVLRLFFESFNNLIMETKAGTATEVIEHVTEWAKGYSSSPILSASTT